MVDIENNKKFPNIAICAGGTGGHIIPAMALKERLEKDKITLATGSYNQKHVIVDQSIIFLTDKKYSSFCKSDGASNIFAISAGNIRGKNVFRLFLESIKILLGFFKSLSLFTGHDIKIVFTFGGYPTIPALLAAVVLRKKIIIHEQNSFLGRTNKFFLRFADTLAISFANTEGIDKQYMDKVVFTGMPIKKPLEDLNSLEQKPLTEDDYINIVVIGGSQGAQIFSTIIPEVIKKLDKELLKKINLVQQCRQEDINNVGLAYNNLGIKHQISSFFHNMQEILKDAHLIIARSGSSTLSEIACVGVASILVPYPYASDDHQKKNALFYTSKNAAILLEQKDFSADNLLAIINDLLSNPKKMLQLGKEIKKLARIGALDELAKLCYEDIDQEIDEQKQEQNINID